MSNSDSLTTPLPARCAFVVQFGHDTDPQQGRFAGQVEHLASGRQRRFAGLEPLLAFFADALAESIGNEPLGEKSLNGNGDESLRSRKDR